jgi:hypothetical protein
MIRTWLEYLLQVVLDRTGQIPWWLGWLVRRDAGLAQYVRDSRQLDQRLRVTAQEVRRTLVDSSETMPVTLPVRPSGYAVARAKTPDRLRHREARWLRPLTAAAVLLVGFLAMHTYRQHTRNQWLQFLSQEFAAVPGDFLSMLSTAAATSQESTSLHAPWNQIALPERDLWQTVASGTQGQVEASLAHLVAPWKSVEAGLGDEWWSGSQVE